MKSVKNKFLFIFAVAVIVSAPFDSYAWLSFKSTKTKMFEEAVEAQSNAEKAKDEGRIMDELTALSNSMALFRNLANRYPNYKTDHVVSKFNQCHDRLQILKAMISTGQIEIPDVDDASRGETLGVDENSQTTKTFSRKIPPLIPAQTAYDVLDGKPLVASHDSTEAEDTGSAPQTPEISTEDLLEIEYEIDENFALLKERMVNGSDNVRISQTEDLIKSGNAADAVLIFEDILDEEKNASTVTRLMFVRALIECRNYTRAESELKKISTAEMSNPAVLTLAAAIAVQRGNLIEATLKMDRLLLDHPGYSDAYVNMAYIYLLMNPEKNRDMAIRYYKTALSFGAKRDPGLETELDIEVEN